MWRLNQLVRWSVKDDVIIFSFPEKKITLGLSQKLIDLLEYCEQRKCFSRSELIPFDCPEVVVKALIARGIFLEVGSIKSGGEAFIFHKTTKVPNATDYDLSKEAMEAVYDRYDGEGERIHNNEENRKDVSQTCDISEIVGSSRYREKEENSVFDELYFIDFIVSLFCQQGHKQRGSAGGFYSILMVTLTEYDTVIIADAYQNTVLKKNIPGIWSHCSDLLTPDDSYSINGYGAITFLIADTKRVMQKYGKRGYRYLLLEAGALGLLFRRQYSSRGYLELGGWYDDRINTLIHKHIFTMYEDRFFVAHALLLHR